MAKHTGGLAREQEKVEDSGPPQDCAFIIRAAINDRQAIRARPPNFVALILIVAQMKGAGVCLLAPCFINVLFGRYTITLIDRQPVCVHSRITILKLLTNRALQSLTKRKTTLQ
jgi:hypothetical protein